MPYVVLWREAGYDRARRSRCHLTRASAQRKLTAIRGRRPPERRRRLRVEAVAWGWVMLLVLIRLLLLGVVLSAGIGVSILIGWP